MNNETIVEQNHENQDSPLSLPSHQHASHFELLTKIYYPETLYPDSYSFFADRADRKLSQAKFSLPMETTVQYPTKPVDPTDHPTIVSIVSKQGTPEIEIADRQKKHSVPMLDRERGESEADKHRFDVKRYIPTALRAQDKTQPPGVLLDPRFYSMKKTAMTIMCLLIIIMSNSVQLKHVLKVGNGHAFYGTQVTLGIISVIMCASIGVILMYVMRIDLNDLYKQHKLDYIDNIVFCLLFILAIFNIFIAACS
ncbi:unnamed protein product [Rotaria socialis]|uniref:Uncharacterized protein n=1 Tax=Rotaria socialis TaxID=392032 RepID=A0A818QFK8_9BILA|nr:unnamed protein product [Rotaria socialis]CAF3608865.1 unnamed protein product [Rotaria socialis]CAF3636566.1 unnamed protein product [Rotaria socialis]CAF3731373.1 unnamed protein product [Rotaria socialis]CAF4260399.1 unnamed protein product [Rotaria socialis]